MLIEGTADLRLRRSGGEADVPRSHVPQDPDVMVPFPARPMSLPLRQAVHRVERCSTRGVVRKWAMGWILRRTTCMKIAVPADL